MSDALAEEFARRHPAAAARELATHDQDDAENVLTSLPPGLAAQVVARMPTHFMASMLRRIDTPVLAAMLLEGTRPDGTVIRAHLDKNTTRHLMDHARAAELDELAASLASSADTLGDMANDQFVRLESTTTAEVAAGEIASAAEDTDKLIVVTDDSGIYKGVLAPIRLLAPASRTQPVGTLVSRLDPLSTSMSVSAARGAPQWHASRTLPLTDSSGAFAGIVHLADVERASRRAEPETSGFEDMLTLLGQGYLGLCGDLLEIMFGREST